MKKLYNLNHIWSKFIVENLASVGLKNVCISPGSRSTPLTTAFAENKRINKYVIVDERSSAYFALGLAKQTNQPVAIVTTSGTAAVNLHPAIVEAYQQRIPLIVCTTDRPESLRGTAANQTINQNNLYRNHVRFAEDIPLPKLQVSSFKSLKKTIDKAILIAINSDRGPVHLNFQFDKPLEKTITDIRIDDDFFTKLTKLNSSLSQLSSSPNESFIPKTILKKINQTEKGIILVGWENFEKNFISELLKFSAKTNFPILADGASGIFLKSNHKNIITNHQAFLRSKKFNKTYSPELVIQFGNPPTSNTMLDFIKETDAYRISVNKYGDRKDSGEPFDTIINLSPVDFCTKAETQIKKKTEKDFLLDYQRIDYEVERYKKRFFDKVKLSDEIGIVNEVIEAIHEKSNLFISNSLPIRDLEFFKSKRNKKINLFVNRGASGIDGINSTAAGIAASSKHPTILVTGDLSFFHDTNGLHTILKYKIPITIVLINNGGGAIFGMLPIYKEKINFDEYFLTSLNLNFSKLIKTYEGSYSLIKSYKALATKISESVLNRSFTLLEIKTNYKEGIELRKKYFREVVKEIEKEI